MKTPSPAELRAFMDKHGLSQRRVTEMLDDVGMRMIAHYTDESSRFRISYPQWYTLHHKVTGKVPKE